MSIKNFLYTCVTWRFVTTKEVHTFKAFRAVTHSFILIHSFVHSVDYVEINDCTTRESENPVENTVSTSCSCWNIADKKKHVLFLLLPISCYWVVIGMHFHPMIRWSTNQAPPPIFFSTATTNTRLGFLFLTFLSPNSRLSLETFIPTSRVNAREFVDGDRFGKWEVRWLFSKK